MQPKIVRVCWRDIGSASDKWVTRSEILQQAQEVYDTERYTYGEVIEENKNYIVVASTRDENEMYHDVSMIMRNVIVRIERLYLKTTRK